MVAVGVFLLVCVAVLTVAVVIGGAELTEIHIDRLALEGSTTAFFFMGAGTAVATCIGIGCLLVGFARGQARRRSDPYVETVDPYADDRDPYPEGRDPYPEGRDPYADDSDPYLHDPDPRADDGQARRTGDRPARARDEWTDYGSSGQSRRPRRTVRRAE